ncbi:hypothetical protein SDJN03_09521, partial [Cucurbita argyrosperma subsp. sororia]
MPNSACFPALLRRLLCSGNLPTHPSEALNEPNSEPKLVPPASEPSPGVVARLMGLSSLPDANWVPANRAPGAVSRSKSVNFADYLLHFDTNQAHHRRIRTSASFREVPALSPQNEFFVLYTKDYFDGYAVEIESNLKKLETQRFGEEKQGKEQSRSNDMKTKKKKMNESKISKLKDEPRREIGKNFTNSKKCSTSKDSFSVLPPGKYRDKQNVPKNGHTVNSKKPVKQQESAIETELNKNIKKKKKKKKNVSRHVGQTSQPESDQENSSPVSVLDVQGIYFSDEMEETDVKGGDAAGRSEKLVERICRLAEEDIKEATWRIKKVDVEELCMEVERHVVNALLVESLEELVLL